MVWTAYEMKFYRFSQINCSWISVLPSLCTSFNSRKPSFTMAWRTIKNESTNIEHRCIVGICVRCYVQGLHNWYRLALLQIFGNASAQPKIHVAIYYSGCVNSTGKSYELIIFIWFTKMVNSVGTRLHDIVTWLWWGHCTESKTTTSTILSSGHGKCNSIDG